MYQPSVVQPTTEPFDIGVMQIHFVAMTSLSIVASIHEGIRAKASTTRFMIGESTGKECPPVGRPQVHPAIQLANNSEAIDPRGTLVFIAHAPRDYHRRGVATFAGD